MTATADPIVAVATAPGRGAIGVVRVSGPDLGLLRDAILRRSTAPRQAVYCPFYDAAGEPIDHGLALFFPAPHSYTGEDVLELQAHGGPVVLQLLMQRLLDLGRNMRVRPARPGEFTERAFLNGKMDLAQAEAVADLIEAQSTQAARLASRSLAGDFSKLIDQMLARLTRLRMLIEATLDFPEEEVDVLAREGVVDQLAQLRQQVDDVLRQASMGARLREGMSVVIVGEPNVGKSSLLNALAGDEIAIVTPIAGTTRDRIRETILIEGMPVNIIDTAGLRETDDAVEQIGVARAREEMARADLLLWVISADQGAEQGGGTSRDEQYQQVMALAQETSTPVLTLLNKIDLLDTAPVLADDQLAVSAKTGLGIDELRERLLTSFGWKQVAEASFMARERHLVALRETAAHLQAAAPMLDVGLELVAEELRLAQQALGEVTGVMTADELLGEIFSSFCIGK